MSADYGCWLTMADYDSSTSSADYGCWFDTGVWLLVGGISRYLYII